MSFCSKLGFLRAEDRASFSLKCTPFFFSSRKLANFAVVDDGGEPGGEGGMSRFGIGGSVRSRSRAREVEYGDCGWEVFAVTGEGDLGGPEGPTMGSTSVVSGIRPVSSDGCDVP